MYSLKAEASSARTLSAQSPKCRTGKSRPGTSIGFSLLDVNPKSVNFKGVKVNETYSRDALHTQYGNFLVRAKNEFKDYKEVEKEIKTRRAESACKPILKKENARENFPTDGCYFKEYNKEYIRLLNNATQDFKTVKLQKEEIKQRGLHTEVMTDTRNYNHTASNFFRPKPAQKDYLESDIFNVQESISSYKTNEKYTVDRLKNLKKPYTITSKSNSEWTTYAAQPSLLGHSSIEHHILNPGIVNIAKTKHKIISESGGFNPIYRQKMLCEYQDITRNGCPNPAKEFRQIIKENKFLFDRTSDLCTQFLDCHHRNYKNISQPPFKK